MHLAPGNDCRLSRAELRLGCGPHVKDPRERISYRKWGLEVSELGYKEVALWTVTQIITELLNVWADGHVVFPTLMYSVPLQGWRKWPLFMVLTGEREEKPWYDWQWSWTPRLISWTRPNSPFAFPPFKCLCTSQK